MTQTLEKPPYVPPPIGTIRGPFRCGIGHDRHGREAMLPDQGLQFCVRAPGGDWVYFIEHFTKEAEIRKQAEEYRAKVLREMVVGL